MSRRNKTWLFHITMAFQVYQQLDILRSQLQNGIEKNLIDPYRTHFAPKDLPTF